MTVPAPKPQPPVTSPAEAEQLVAHFTGVMDNLRQVVEEETELVRAGRIEAAMQLGTSKSELARAYAADVTRFKTSQAFLVQTMPGRLRDVQQRHDCFRLVLQLNLTVLATAHAVSQGIIRGVAGELARKSAPQTYGASGRAMAAPKGSCQPLALSRTL